ncbi:MAG: YceI family protein [Pedobacter sp.]|nr:YceI family protein [Pedobacter sp.]
MKTILHFTILRSPFKYMALLIFMGLASGQDLKAQSNYKLNAAKENLIRVSGKSNVHDWAMTANNPTCEADFGPLAGNENVPKTLSSLSFSVNAKSLKSEHSSMDTRTYKVIKADEHPKISFKLSYAVITPISRGKFSVKATGTLSIAGVSKMITMQVNSTVNPDQSITCTGTQRVKLTDYSIQPPSFMLGAMKVGDELSINYNLTFKN